MLLLVLHLRLLLLHCCSDVMVAEWLSPLVNMLLEVLYSLFATASYARSVLECFV